MLVQQGHAEAFPDPLQMRAGTRVHSLRMPVTHPGAKGCPPGSPAPHPLPHQSHLLSTHSSSANAAEPLFRDEANSTTSWVTGIARYISGMSCPSLYVNRSSADANQLARMSEWAVEG